MRGHQTPPPERGVWLVRLGITSFCISPLVLPKLPPPPPPPPPPQCQHSLQRILKCFYTPATGRAVRFSPLSSMLIWVMCLASETPRLGSHYNYSLVWQARPLTKCSTGCITSPVRGRRGSGRHAYKNSCIPQEWNRVIA